MKCFYHQDRDAVALCKSCQRAVCMECAADVPPGIACRGRCEQEVAELNLMLERSKSAYQKTGKAYRRNSLVLALMGLAMSGFGLLAMTVRKDPGALFLVVLGGLMLLFSFFSLRNAQQIERTNQ